MAELKRLHHQRGFIKAKMSALIKFLELGSDHAKQNITLLKFKMSSLEKAFETLEELTLKISELEDSDNAIQEHEEMSELYDVTISQANDILEEEISRNPIIINQNNVANANSNSHLAARPSLPPITLPRFDGTLENWATFIDSFRSLTEGENLPDIRKLQYLRSSLTGKAARCIESLETSEENYEVAMSILKDKFECKRRTVLRHWAIMREYPRLTKDTPQALNNLVDVFNQHTRALENLRVPVSTWDVPILDLILSKISSTTSWHWELTLQDDNIPSYQQLIKFLDKRASASPNQSDESQREYIKRAQTFFTSHHTQSKSSNSSQEFKLNCLACHKDHTLFKCEEFRSKSINDRQLFVKTNALCLNCLTKGHTVLFCKSKFSCKKCSKKHNTLLHVDKSINEAVPSTSGETIA